MLDETIIDLKIKTLLYSKYPAVFCGQHIISTGADVRIQVSSSTIL